MIAMNVKEATKGFFDRQAVIDAVGRAKATALPKAAGPIRVTAQRSMKPARRKKVDELNEGEKAHYDIQIRDWKKAKKSAKQAAKKAGTEAEKITKPKLPYALSKSGEPPRTILKFVRKFLFFAWDAKTESVVIGPARLNGRSGTAPGTLEHGGTAVVGNRRKKTIEIKARPFMQPALKANKAKVAAVWKNAIK